MKILQVIRTWWWVALLTVGVQPAGAYSLLGPTGNGGDSWQVQQLGYPIGGDIGSAKNIGEEYRRNTPVLFYACDASFYGYFGSNGVSAIDGAFDMLNSLTNVDLYSSDLSEFPDYSQTYNTTAQSLFLTDLRSVALGVVTEELGLADSVRYTWALHDRRHINGFPPCPAGMEYLVVQRNFGIVPSSPNTLEYSPYVNDTLYSYHIFEGCNTTPVVAETVPFSVDPFALVNTPVSAFAGTFIDNGFLYTGFTRDDIAGLRYLYTTNNVNTETPAAGSLVENTNVLGLTTVSSADFHTLFLFSLTNDPALLLTTFGVTATLVSNDFTVVAQPDVVGYFTNKIGAPVGSPPQFVIVTNGFTYIPLELFFVTFDNILTNRNLTNTPNVVLANTNIHLLYFTNTPAVLATTYLTNQPGAPVGSPLITNTSLKAITITNMPSGEYLPIPVGQCGWKILQILATNVTVTSNLVASATNTDGFTATQYIIRRFTNHIFKVQPIVCSNTPAADAVGLYQGIENIKFVRANFDSLIGQFFQPVTNTYTMTMVTNSQLVTRRYHRIAAQPDFLFTTEDRTSFNGGFALNRSVSFNQDNILPNLAGPGTIEPPVTVTLNRSAPIFDIFNPTGFLVGETNHVKFFAWGSFDASTNDPVVYPNGTSIQNVANQLLVHVTPPPPGLPDGTNGVAYAAVGFSATGGSFSTPFTWSATGLPAGLSMASDGTLSGTPTQAGTFDIVVRMTDVLGRSVQWDYVLIIH